MMHVTIRIVTKAENQKEAFAILRSVAEQTKVEPDCISSRIYRDTQNDCALMFEELWKSEEYLYKHIRSDTYRKVLFVIEMAVEEPEIRFETISRANGIETIEQARGAA
jgi:quinol monooxygenase YgiN